MAVTEALGRSLRDSREQQLRQKGVMKEVFVVEPAMASAPLKGNKVESWSLEHGFN